MKIPEQLKSLMEAGIIEYDIRPLMSGKEAQVYLVKYRGEFCIAKVYKQLKNRSFRQRSVYAEGRKTKNSRDERAMKKSGHYGREIQEEAWKNGEAETLFRLFNAGVKVPRPHDFIDGVLIMDLVKDEDSDPAPRLAELGMSEEIALQIFHLIIKQVVLMLCQGIVHGDLSEYNILYGQDGPAIIDFPQAIDASANRNAKELFVRDVENVTKFLAQFNSRLKNTQYAQEIWELYEQSALKPETLLTGRWKDPRKKANVNQVVEEIEYARLEHMKKTLKKSNHKP